MGGVCRAGVGATGVLPPLSPPFGNIRGQANQPPVAAGWLALKREPLHKNRCPPLPHMPHGKWRVGTSEHTPQSTNTTPLLHHPLPEGYSDSGKDAGRMAAAWALFKTQEKIVQVRGSCTRGSCTAAVHGG